MKIVLNRQHGGFDLSHEAIMLLAKKQGIKLFIYYKDNRVKEGNLYTKKFTNNIGGPHYLIKDYGDECHLKTATEDAEWWRSFYDYLKVSRTNQYLIEVVEELGNNINTYLSTLEIFKIPDNSFYEIIDYDGYESIVYSESEIKII